MKRLCSFGGRWADDDFDTFPVAEVFLSHPLDLIKGDLSDLFLADLVVVIAETQQLVGGAKSSESGMGLVVDGLAPQEFCLGTIKFLRGQPFGGKLGDLVIELALGQIDFLGIGSEIKDEGTRSQARGVGGPDEVGKSQLLADPVEEAGSEITGSLRDEFKRGTIRTGDGSSEKSLHDDSLLLGTLRGSLDGRGQRGGHGRCGEELLTCGERSEVFLGKLEGFLSLDRAKDGEDTIASGHKAVTE